MQETELTLLRSEVQRLTQAHRTQRILLLTALAFIAALTIPLYAIDKF